MNKKNLEKIAIKDVKIAISEDLGPGDITTSLLGKDKNILVNSIVKSNEDGIFCGQIWFNSSFKYVQKKYGGSLNIKWLKKDGDKIKKGQIICKIKAPLKTTLLAERTALNFIQLLSGVSSKTNIYAKKIKKYKAKILDTRKTVPGIRSAQKYAVLCGGGFNHRFGLYDQILIKENHIIEKSKNFENFLKKIKEKIDFNKISIEVENIKELKIAISYKPKNILLDNFTYSNIKKACSIINKTKTTIEISGNVNLKNIKKYANLNIDYISIGDLTKNVNSLDFSLRVSKSLF